jgi:hypothetical protein
MLGSFQAAVAKARRQQSLLFASLVSEESILEAFGSARWLWQGWIYSPAVTVWVFLSQCLSMDHSCRDAVARLITWRMARGLRPCSADTGAYCTAREGLPEAGCHQLVRQTGSDLEREAPAEWRWHKRRVRVVDGSTITMPDTAANQAEYPQMASQKPGCGFPMPGSSSFSRCRSERCSKRPSGSMEANRRARTACSAPFSTVWTPATSWWLTVISAAGAIWRFCRRAGSTWSCANTSFATPTFGKGGDWEKTTIWFAGPGRLGPNG